jgi:flagellar hook assembly protein FlgD
VTVTGLDGAVVATGTGTSSDIDWTWDAATAPKGRYAWSIAAGDDIRAATGFVGAAPVPLTLTKTSAKPATISPNGDGQQDKATITYTLSASATVTAVLRAPDGHQLAVLFSDRRSPGKQTFTFTADGVPDGRYQIVISATDGKATVTKTVPVVVDRTVANFVVKPRVFSPNGDGRQDAISLSYELAREASVRVDVKRGAQVVAAIFVGTLGSGRQTLTWDGIAPGGVRLPDGSYSLVMTTTTPLGATTHALALRVDTRPPVLRAVSFRRLVFRLDEAARVTAVIDGRRVVRAVRAGTFSLGRSAGHVRVWAQDYAGNLSRTLRWR